MRVRKTFTAQEAQTLHHAGPIQHHRWGVHRLKIVLVSPAGTYLARIVLSVKKDSIVKMALIGPRVATACQPFLQMQRKVRIVCANLDTKEILMDTVRSAVLGHTR
jgi:hypothetical protein